MNLSMGKYVRVAWHLVTKRWSTASPHYLYSNDPRGGEWLEQIVIRAELVQKFKRIKSKAVDKIVKGKKTVELVDETVADVAVFRLLEPVECRGYAAGKLVAAYLDRDVWRLAISENDFAREWVDPAIIKEICEITGFAYKLTRDW
jgi:hypothetical protein